MDNERMDRETAETAADARANITKATRDVFRELLEHGVPLALMFRRNDFRELRSLPDEQLHLVFRLARMGHTCLCAEVMEGAYRNET